MVAGPEVARVIEEFQDVGQHCRQKKADTRHHDQTPSVQTSFVKDVRSLVDVIEEMGNPFEEESQDVVKLDTKEIAGPAAVETVMNAKKIGQEQFEAFTKECLFDRTKAVYDPIHRNNLKVFRTSTPRNQSKGQQQLVSVKNDRELFARLYIGCQTRGGNLEQFFCHENQACPPALSDCGGLCTGTKSDLLTCLEDVFEANTETPPTTCIVLDGAAIVQMLKPATSKSFEEYAQHIFIPYISTKLQVVSRLDLVWDTYLADSLKCSTRAKRGQGVRRRVVAAASIPGNWSNFLRVDSNKTELFRFLSAAVMDWFNHEDKQLIITDGEAVLSKPVIPDLTSLAPCNHEEADSQKKTLRKKEQCTAHPPTKAALDEHIKRAAYQGGHVWDQILLPAPELPPPTNWGWSRTAEGQYTPYWTSFLPESINWLAVRGSKDDILKASTQVARINHLKVENELEKIITTYCENRKLEDQHHVSIRTYLSNAIARRYFIILSCIAILTTITFAGLPHASSDLSDHPFISFSVGSAFDSLGPFLQILLLERIGRRWFLSGCLLLSATFGLLAAFFSHEGLEEEESIDSKESAEGRTQPTLQLISAPISQAETSMIRGSGRVQAKEKAKEEDNEEYDTEADFDYPTVTPMRKMHWIARLFFETSVHVVDQWFESFIEYDKDLQFAIESNVIFISLLIPSRLFGVQAFCVLALFITELIPTEFRGRGVALIQTFGAVSSVFAPFIIYLKIYNKALPLIVMSATSITSSILVLFLPETTRQKLPQTIADIQEFKKQPFCFIPCKNLTDTK
ncbi:Solute carrier family 22 member 4 [Nymphon striatum]|nr:Solute carrier family 22 member 4 [Nymphon striatum]